MVLRLFVLAVSLALAPVVGVGAEVSTRFTSVGNGTVLDRLTGLYWLENANCFDRLNWEAAVAVVKGLASGSCGLSDGSTPGMWRLPSKGEWERLLDKTNRDPPLPTGAPFFDVQRSFYWSGTDLVDFPTYAWYVSLSGGGLNTYEKSYCRFVWPVREPY